MLSDRVLPRLSLLLTPGSSLDCMLVSDEGLRDPPRELSDVRFELHDDGIAYITLDR